MSMKLVVCSVNTSIHVIICNLIFDDKYIILILLVTLDYVDIKYRQIKYLFTILGIEVSHISSLASLSTDISHK
jgi:hypothetical protein